MKLWTTLLMFNVNTTNAIPQIWSLATTFSILLVFNMDQIPLNVLLFFSAIFCDLIVFFLLYLFYLEIKKFKNKSWIYV